MKIVCVSESIKKNLLSIQYDGIDVSEFRRIINYWNDPKDLKKFFEDNQTDLNSGYFGTISVSKAIQRTIFEAKKLEKIIYDVALAGQSDATNNLQILFKPLYNKEKEKYPIPQLQESKVYGKTWLRIYAVRIGINCFVISGGAIKLTKDMQAEHLKDELEKLKSTKQYLKDIDFVDDDYELLDFFELK